VFCPRCNFYFDVDENNKLVDRDEICNE